MNTPANYSAVIVAARRVQQACQSAAPTSENPDKLRRRAEMAKGLALWAARKAAEQFAAAA